MTNIMTSLALALGTSMGHPQGYPDVGRLDIVSGSGLFYRVDDRLSAMYDCETRDLFGYQFIDRRTETVPATFARFERQVADFEKLFGEPFGKGVYMPWSTGLFSYDYATLSNETGIVYVFCHYRKGVGLVQWGARRPLAQPSDGPFGADYRAQWTDELNAEIDARIERVRKADGVFALPASAAGRAVRVEQIESAFQIGCNIFNFDQFGDANRNAAYRAAFGRDALFNAATVPFYWRELEPERGKTRYRAGKEDEPDYWKTHGDKDLAWRRPAPGKILDYCDANGVSVHGHVLIYPGFHPDWVNAVTNLEERMALYGRHIAEVAARYGRRIPQWDIVNESVDRACTPANPHDAVPWCKIPQPKDYTFRSFQAAAAAFPADVRLCINDAHTGDPGNGRYPAFVEKLLKSGAKIDVIGAQMHIFHEDDAVAVASGSRILWRPADQIAMLRRYDRIGKPIHISEITIPAPVTLMPRAEAEALQARLLRDCYRLWFSWPSVYRITYWNAVDLIGGEILESGFFRRDMTKKPVCDMLWNLVHEEWRTRTEATADAQGVIRFRGFKGKYRLSWTDADGRSCAHVVTL